MKEYQVRQELGLTPKDDQWVVYLDGVEVVRRQWRTDAIDEAVGRAREVIQAGGLAEVWAVSPSGHRTRENLR